MCQVSVAKLSGLTALLMANFILRVVPCFLMLKTVCTFFLVKTSPPSHVRRVLEKDKLCLTWEAPLPSLSAYLQYEVNYWIRGWEAWLVRWYSCPPFFLIVQSTYNSLSITHFLLSHVYSYLYCSIRLLFIALKCI